MNGKPFVFCGMKCTFPKIVLLVSIACCMQCKSPTAILDPIQAYQLKQYAVAIPLLKTAYQKESLKNKKAKYAFWIGESYEKINQHIQAADWYQLAWKNQYGIEAQRRYATLLVFQQKYSEAIQVYRELQTEMGNSYSFSKEITLCQQAIYQLKHQDTFSTKIQPASFNSDYNDFAPVHIKNDILLYTSDRLSPQNEQQYQWTGLGYTNILMTGTDPRIQSLLNTINGPYNDGTLTITPDLDHVIFTRCAPLLDGNPGTCKLMETEWQQDAWLEPIEISFQKEGVHYGHPTLSKDGSTLIFSSNLSTSQGGWDLFTSELTREGWDTPEPLPTTINTSKNEEFPTLIGDTLFFASNGLPGMGGLDLFYSIKDKNLGWLPAQNLLPPINSGSDDFGITIDKIMNTTDSSFLSGYFSSNRIAAQHGDEIYEFHTDKKLTNFKPTSKVPEYVFYRVVITQGIYENKNDPNSKIITTKPCLMAQLQKLPGETRPNESSSGQVSTTLPEGFILVLPPKSQPEQWKASAPFMMASTFTLQPVNPNVYQSESDTLFIDKEITLLPLIKNIEIEIPDIYYDFDKSELRKDAYPALDKLLRLLKDNPDLQIEIGSHTDCRGTDTYNQNLSLARARSVTTYLVQQLIASNRLSIKGYGESQPKTNCICNQCNEYEHQLNRRTTFKILETE